MSINEDKWQSLNQAQQTALVEAADEAGTFFNEKVNASLESWTKELEAMGVIFHEVDTSAFVERIAQRNREWQAQGYWPEGLIPEIESLR